ncbi:MAG: aldo/keto reductase, partial [Muribaculaceae bacterium]|nr:aldo/keto reductase [Muribaculaceae bacterium]
MTHINNKIDRREFLRRLAMGTTAVAAATLPGCRNAAKDSSGSPSADAFTGSMTTRHNPTTGDDVSLLGYGCMRWPTLPEGSYAEGESDLDQEEVNRLVDRALACGVNYFDTSPAYCKGFSEAATGEALSRHPRDSYFIATKLSNFAPATWSREASLDMYHRSFENLRTDYIDYLLLHGVGMGGMESLHGRYLDNGVLDFLLKEREAG